MYRQLQNQTKFQVEIVPTLTYAQIDPIYQDFLDEFKEVLEGRGYGNYTMTENNSLSQYRNNFQDIGYQLIDINNDDYPELFVGLIWEQGQGHRCL